MIDEGFPYSFPEAPLLGLMITFTDHIGKATLLSVHSLLETLALAARVSLKLFHRRTFNSACRMVFAQQLYATSVQILPLFLCVALIFGFLFNGMAFQAVKHAELADSLRRLLMGFVVTEFSPFVTVLLIALRSSSVTNAEMAVMKVSGELNTLESFRIDPIHYLFVPRILSGMLSMVLLTGLFALVVVSSGLVISSPLFGISADAYIDALLQSTDLLDIVVMLCKCATFGFFITLISIQTGLNASAELADIPLAILNGMVRVFMAIVTIEVLSSIIRFI